MARSAREIFQRNKTKHDVPLLRGVHGTYLFDIEQVGSWFVSVDNGAVTVDEIRNHTAKPIDLDIRMDAAADFADLFQVKDSAFKRKGEFYNQIDSNRLVLGCKRDRFVRETWIKFECPCRDR